MINYETMTDKARFVQLPDGSLFDMRAPGVEYGFYFGIEPNGVRVAKNGDQYAKSRHTGVNTFSCTLPNGKAIHYEWLGEGSKIDHEYNVLRLNYTRDLSESRQTT